MSEKANKALYMALSLLFAIVFWLYVDNVQGNTITEKFNDIPVEFLGADDTLPSRNLVVVGGSEITVDLELSGPRTVITGLRSSDIGLQVDLTGVTAVGTYPLTPKLVLPSHISRNDVVLDKSSASTISVVVEQMFEKTVPVDVRVTGAVADGCIYMAEKLSADPSSITLTGREEEVDQVTSALIVLDLTDANTTVSKEFDYALLDGSGNVVDSSDIKVSDKRVMVTAPLYITKTLDLVVNVKEGPGSMSEHANIKIDPNKIEVAGEAASLENKDSILLGELDLSSFLSDTEVDLDVSLPAGCINLSGFSSVSASIDFIGLETRTFAVSNISAIGLGTGQRFSRVTNSIDVLVRGSAEDLELLTGEEIRIVVDLTEFVSSGTYSVPAIVLVDGFEEVGAVGSYSVACKITS